MTTTVRVTAHCADDQEVLVLVIDHRTREVKERVVLQNGESLERYAYGDQVVQAFEVPKQHTLEIGADLAITDIDMCAAAECMTKMLNRQAVDITLDQDDPNPEATIERARHAFGGQDHPKSTLESAVNAVKMYAPGNTASCKGSAWGNPRVGDLGVIGFSPESIGEKAKCCGRCKAEEGVEYKHLQEHEGQQSANVEHAPE